MAQDLPLMDTNCSQLQKADIFSLGLSVYEAASLRILPKNSFNDQQYENIRDWKLPYLGSYSRRFNNLLSSIVLVNPDPCMSPPVSKLVKNFLLNKRNSKSQLNKEMNETNEKLQLLMNLIGQETIN